MKDLEHIFKAYDIRGLLEEVSPEVAAATARAAYSILHPARAVVAFDMRETSSDLAEVIVAELSKLGVEVDQMGLSSSSLFNFAVTEYGYHAGFMVTASHNPAEYNGIKVVRSGGRPLSGHKLFEHIDDQASFDGPAGAVKAVNFLDDYLRTIKSFANTDLSSLKVIADYGNGMGAIALKPLLASLNIESEHIYDQPDATFPNHEANPLKAETLEELQKRVGESDGAIGIATDGDGDRIAFVDEKGRIVPSYKTLVLLTRGLNKITDISKVVSPVNISNAFLEELEKMDIEYQESRIGWSFVTEVMRESGAKLGGEVSGHYFFERFGSREVIDFAALLVLEEVASSGKSLADLADEMIEYSNSGEVNTEVADKDAVLAKIKETYADRAQKINELDGVRCDFENWWFIMRPSNTEPVIRLTVEADTEEMVAEKVAELKEFLV